MNGSRNGLNNKEAVRQFLEQNGRTRFSDIVRSRVESQNGVLKDSQVSGALTALHNDGAVERVEHGVWRIANAPKPSGEMPYAAEPLDIRGLPSKEVVFRILENTREPMKHRDIVKWLEENGQELRDGQISSALYDLSTYYVDVVEKVRRGTYSIHKEWNGEPLDKQSRKGGAIAQSVSKEPQRRVVIPCFGLHWERGLVSWRAGSLLGRKHGEKDADAVNFANQTGVYLLYQWPQVTYVGRTVGGLYQRLCEHESDADKSPWDRFSWFGLIPVDDDGRLEKRPGEMSIEDQVTMMEALLIRILTPPDNLKRCDRMGVQYVQVPDPMVEEHQQRALATTFNQLLNKILEGKGRGGISSLR